MSLKTILTILYRITIYLTTCNYSYNTFSCTSAGDSKKISHSFIEQSNMQLYKKFVVNVYILNRDIDETRMEPSRICKACEYMSEYL